MARIIYALLASLDGYIAGPEGGPTLPVPDGALHRHFNDMMKQTSVALLNLDCDSSVVQQNDRRPAAVHYHLAQCRSENESSMFLPSGKGR
jgi:hypothetical protein